MNNIAKFVEFAYFDSHAIDTHATVQAKPNIDDHKRKDCGKMGGEEHESIAQAERHYKNNNNNKF